MPNGIGRDPLRVRGIGKHCRCDERPRWERRAEGDCKGGEVCRRRSSVRILPINIDPIKLIGGAELSHAFRQLFADCRISRERLKLLIPTPASNGNEHLNVMFLRLRNDRAQMIRRAERPRRPIRPWNQEGVIDVRQEREVNRSNVGGGRHIANNLERLRSRGRRYRNRTSDEYECKSDSARCCSNEAPH